jgi:prolyl-tRNA synthetase
MVHGDDNGLVLPPAVAPIQAVIVPIRQSEPGVLDACKKLYDALVKEGVRVKLDDDETKTPGWKFAEYEMKGVPLRIEVGPRDLAKGECVLTKRVNGEKTITKLDALPERNPRDSKGDPRSDVSKGQSLPRFAYPRGLFD